MIAQETWRRFVAYFPALALAGLFSALITLAIAAVGGLLAGGLLMSDAMMLMMGGAPSVAALMGLVAKLAAAAAITGVVAVLVAPLATGGLLYTVEAARKDRAARPGEFWQAAVRYWRPLLVYGLIMIAVVIALVIIGAILSLVPFLGTLVWFIGAMPVMLALGGYGPYLVVAEDLDAGTAFRRGLTILSTRLGDLFFTSLLLLGVGFVVALVLALVGLIPFVGDVVAICAQILTGPLLALYLATRYHTNIRPAIAPPGGTASFHRDPPGGE